MDAAAELILNNTTLQDLHLFDNPIGEMGAKALEQVR